MGNLVVHRYGFPKEEFRMTVFLSPEDQILHFDYQKAKAQFSIWVLVDPEDSVLIERTFQIVATGQQVVEHNEHRASYHVGSCLIDDFYIFHCFEVHDYNPDKEEGPSDGLV